VTLYPRRGSLATKSKCRTGCTLSIWIDAGYPNSSTYRVSWWTTVWCPNRCLSNFPVNLAVRICQASSHTWEASWNCSPGVCFRFASSSCTAWLPIVLAGVTHGHAPLQPEFDQLPDVISLILSSVLMRMTAKAHCTKLHRTVCTWLTRIFHYSRQIQTREATIPDQLADGWHTPKDSVPHWHSVVPSGHLLWVESCHHPPIYILAAAYWSPGSWVKLWSTMCNNC
jgi:hypothetical protein